MLFTSRQVRKPHSRVVITGAGLITPLGSGWESNSIAFRAGRTAFRPVTLFDVSRQRVKRAAEVDLPELPRTRLPNRTGQRMDRAARLLLLAALEAWTASRWSSSSQLPVVLGTTSGGMSLGETYLRHCLSAPQTHYHQAGRIIHYQAQRQGLDLLEALGCQGAVTVIANACASGANAVGHAWELIRWNQCEKVLAGAYDALSQLVFSGFDSLQALSPTQCRPFDAERDGLALGEGAAVFALESLESAQARKAEILGEIAGYGAATDAHHLTQPHPDGEAALRSMRAACQCAGLGPQDIGYINAHGTGTVMNDSAEAAAINEFAGAFAGQLPVSSTKASIGHLLGAAGAVEAAVCLMALQGQWLPPTPTFRKPDPAVRFPVVQTSRKANIEFALSNSFGFGGSNATLILRRWP